MQTLWAQMFALGMLRQREQRNNEEEERGFLSKNVF